MSFNDKLIISGNINEELDLAQRSYDEQDFNQTIFHLGSALALEPNNQKVLIMLTTIFEKSLIDINTITLENDDKVLWISNLTVVTYGFGYEKNYDHALVNLAKLLLLTEETLYLYWLEDWLTDENFFTTLSFDALKKSLVHLLVLPNQAEFNHNIREIYEFFFKLLEKAENYYDFDEQLMYIMAVLARRSLQFHKSIFISAKSYGVKPSYFNTLALAYAYKELKDYDNTVRFFQEAINFRPDVIEAKLDLADFLTARAIVLSEDFKKGVQLYKDVVNINPHHSWAYPSYLCYSYILKLDGSLLDQLEKYANDNPTNERAQELLLKAKLVKIN